MPLFIRKIGDKFQHTMYYGGAHSLDTESELQSSESYYIYKLLTFFHACILRLFEFLNTDAVSRIFDDSTSLELTAKPTSQLTCLGYSLEELQLSEG